MSLDEPPDLLLRRIFSWVGVQVIVVLIGLLLLILILKVNRPPRARELARRAATQTTLSFIARELESYHLAHGRFPDSLISLERAAENGPPVEAKRMVEQDCWGNELCYRHSSLGVATVTSYGQDGQPGGEGHAEDLSIEVMPPAGAASRPVASAPTAGL